MNPLVHQALADTLEAHGISDREAVAMLAEFRRNLTKLEDEQRRKQIEFLESDHQPRHD